MEIQDILYKEIENLGKNNVKIEVTKNIQNSVHVINKIIQKTLPSLKQNGYPKNNLIYLVEGLLHFLLTISLLPSSRKIIVNDLEVSILIPNSKYITYQKENLLIIQFIDSYLEDIDSVLKRLLNIQENANQIWIVSDHQLNLGSNFKNFVLEFFNKKSSDKENNVYPFSTILVEIDKYLTNTNYRGLKLL